jgi:Tol biopolymer transport system component/DNA-binding winged helix-turn-helix (wHTH) protein
MMDINGSERLKFGSYETDLHTRELWKHGTRVKLVGQPFEILALLVRRPGQLVTRDELREQLWPGDTFVDFNHGLNAAVNKLRDALCDSADDPKYIETLPRRGYRLIAAVESSIARSAMSGARSDSGSDLARVLSPIAVQTPAVSLEDSNASTDLSSPTKYDLETGSRRTFVQRMWVRYAAYGIVAVIVLGLMIGWKHLHAAYDEKKAQEGAAPSTLAQLTALSDRTTDAAFSPDGTRVAFRRDSFVPGDSGIWIKPIGRDELIQVTKGSGDGNPVWSPDAKSVAFSRVSDKTRTIFEVSVAGGDVHALNASSFVPGHEEIDWSPDGRTIAFAEKGSQGVSAIHLLSLLDRSVRQVTAPSATDEDWGPAFSPDGSQIAFVRSQSIVVMPTEGGEVRRLTEEPARVVGSPAWSPDGSSIIFAASTRGLDGLWRVSAAGGTPAPIPEAGNMVWNPAVSRRGFRLAFELASSARSIDQLDLYPSGQKARTLITAVSGENAGPQLSPDGKRLVFQSDRTGGLDIWVSDWSGQNPIQLTAIGTAGAPRWSPDGKEILFDVGLARDWREPRAIFVVGADGGIARPLLQDTFSNPVPSWSHDGKWIYFASNRSGDWQIWKMLRSGGSPIQLTKQGGFSSIESPDGDYLYYTKHNNESPAIWKVPVAGGDEVPIFPGIAPIDWGAWAVTENGILFANWGGNRIPLVSFYDFRTQGVKQIAVLNKAPFWLTAGHDGRSVIVDQPGQEDSHIMLLENFR